MFASILPMPDLVSDEDLSTLLLQTGIISANRLEQAQALKKQKARKGQLISLGEALVQQGALTSEQKENLERRLQAQAQGGLYQVGPYRILKKLGEGGMGSVYLADDTTLKRKVAVKVLNSAYSSSLEFTQRFKNEAKAAGKLHHPNIVGAYMVGEEAGVTWYSMEYCDGDALHSLLNSMGRIPERMAIDIALQIAKGLKFAHSMGLIHRDIKPENIMFTSNGTAKILDLGLSRDLDESMGGFTTTAGMTVGTPHYISPEQARGIKDLDGRADLYSLGATLFHIATGRTPFDSTDAAVIVTKHLTEEVCDPRTINPEISGNLCALLRKLLDKDRDKRYLNAEMLIEDLERVAHGQRPVHASERTSSKSINLSKGKMPKVSQAKIPIRRPGNTGRLEPVAAREPEEEEPEVRERPSRNARRAQRRAAFNPVYLGLGGGLVVLLGLLWVLSNRPSTATNSSASAAAGTNTTPPVNPSLDARAEYAFVGLFDGLTEDDASRKDAEVARLEAFLQLYGDSSKAQLVRKMLAQRKTLKSDGTLTGPVNNTWIKQVQGLSPDEQVKQVVNKLKELNYFYDKIESHKVEGTAVTELSLSSEQITDISPIKALKNLRVLRCAGAAWDKRGKLSDISALASLPLVKLDCSINMISDLSPLKGMPLEVLTLTNNKKINLGSLPSGLPLKELYLEGSQITDLAPLADFKLTRLSVAYNAINDLTPLKDMPLRSLAIGFTDVQDLSPILKAPLGEYVAIQNCRVSDISGLAAKPVSVLVLNPNRITSGLKEIRANANILKLGTDWNKVYPASEFWSRFDAGEFQPAQ